MKLCTCVYLPEQTVTDAETVIFHYPERLACFCLSVSRFRSNDLNLWDNFNINGRGMIDNL